MSSTVSTPSERAGVPAFSGVLPLQEQSGGAKGQSGKLPSTRSPSFDTSLGSGDVPQESELSQSEESEGSVASGAAEDQLDRQQGPTEHLPTPRQLAAAAAILRLEKEKAQAHQVHNRSMAPSAVGVTMVKNDKNVEGNGVEAAIKLLGGLDGLSNGPNDHQGLDKVAPNASSTSEKFASGQWSGIPAVGTAAASAATCTGAVPDELPLGKASALEKSATHGAAWRAGDRSGGDVPGNGPGAAAKAHDPEGRAAGGMLGRLTFGGSPATAEAPSRTAASVTADIGGDDSTISPLMTEQKTADSAADRMFARLSFGAADNSGLSKAPALQAHSVGALSEPAGGSRGVVVAPAAGPLSTFGDADSSRSLFSAGTSAANSAGAFGTTWAAPTNAFRQMPGATTGEPAFGLLGLSGGTLQVPSSAATIGFGTGFGVTSAAAFGGGAGFGTASSLFGGSGSAFGPASTAAGMFGAGESFDTNVVSSAFSATVGGSFGAASAPVAGAAFSQPALPLPGCGIAAAPVAPFVGTTFHGGPTVSPFEMPPNVPTPSQGAKSSSAMQQALGAFGKAAQLGSGLPAMGTGGGTTFGGAFTSGGGFGALAQAGSGFAAFAQGAHASGSGFGMLASSASAQAFAGGFASAPSAFGGGGIGAVGTASAFRGGFVPRR
jgi:hypothetical protein